MTIVLSIPKEISANEYRVALTPEIAKKLSSIPELTIQLQQDAGQKAGYPDTAYSNISVIETPSNLYGNANIILKVAPPTLDEIHQIKSGAILIGMLAPEQNRDLLSAMQEKRLTSFALELMPRTTRAQAMDVLSSQATIAGYKAVLIAANTIGKLFPMLSTAAGTSRPVKVLVIGAGVAGLQAIATARRLGAIVQAYDIRPDAREQIESLGAKMIETAIDAAGEGGYARELSSEEKALQQEKLGEHVAKQDIIISTAAIPGKTAPTIITKTMVDNMQAGSVIVDIAAETGGNCELTEAGETIYYQDVTIVGPLNLASGIAQDASNMYSRNGFNFLKLLITDNQVNINWDDDILKACVVTHAGELKYTEAK